MKNAGVKKEEIFRVLLVGGSSRIPAVRKMLAKYFPNSVIDSEENPQEIVALGASYLSFQKANPNYVREVELKQLMNNVQPSEKAMPILFGYISDRKWKDTIFRVDSKTLQVKQFKDE